MIKCAIVADAQNANTERLPRNVRFAERNNLNVANKYHLVNFMEIFECAECKVSFIDKELFDSHMERH